jgi:hypothetical protein
VIREKYDEDVKNFMLFSNYLESQKQKQEKEDDEVENFLNPEIR